MKNATFFLLLFLAACTSGPDNPPDKAPQERLMIATAANVQFAMQELAAAFTAQSGIPVETTVSSSGKLTAQIIQGAPYDLLLSANLKYPDTLIARDQAIPPNRTYARGALVLWTTRDLAVERGLELLDDLPGESIAVANPRNAPYGTQSIQVLERTNRLQALRDQLIFGESISQTNQYIVSGAAAIGFTAKSVVRSPEMSEKGRWTDVPDSLYQPIAQGVVITRYGQENHPVAARAFLEFLFSDDAQAIFRSYGYQLPAED